MSSIKDKGLSGYNWCFLVMTSLGKYSFDHWALNQYLPMPIARVTNIDCIRQIEFLRKWHSRWSLIIRFEKNGQRNSFTDDINPLLIHCNYINTSKTLQNRKEHLAGFRSLSFLASKLYSSRSLTCTNQLGTIEYIHFNWLKHWILMKFPKHGEAGTTHGTNHHMVWRRSYIIVMDAQFIHELMSPSDFRIPTKDDTMCNDGESLSINHIINTELRCRLLTNPPNIVP